MFLENLTRIVFAWAKTRTWFFSPLVLLGFIVFIWFEVTSSDGVDSFLKLTVSAAAVVVLALGLTLFFRGNNYYSVYRRLSALTEGKQYRMYTRVDLGSGTLKIERPIGMIHVTLTPDSADMPIYRFEIDEYQGGIVLERFTLVEDESRVSRSQHL